MSKAGRSKAFRKEINRRAKALAWMRGFDARPKRNGKYRTWELYRRDNGKLEITLANADAVTAYCDGSWSR